MGSGWFASLPIVLAILSGIFRPAGAGTAPGPGDPDGMDEKGRTQSEIAAMHRRDQETAKAEAEKQAELFRNLIVAARIPGLPDDCAIYGRRKSECLVTIGEFNQGFERAPAPEGLAEMDREAMQRIAEQYRRDLLAGLLERAYLEEVVEEKGGLAAAVDSLERATGKDALADSRRATRLRALYSRYQDELLRLHPGNRVLAFASTDSLLIDSIHRTVIASPLAGPGRKFPWKAAEIPLRDAPPEFGRVVRNLAAGEWSKPFPLAFGYAILRLPPDTTGWARTFQAHLPALVFMDGSDPVKIRQRREGTAPTAAFENLRRDTVRVEAELVPKRDRPLRPQEQAPERKRFTGPLSALPEELGERFRVRRRGDSGDFLAIRSALGSWRARVIEVREGPGPESGEAGRPAAEGEDKAAVEAWISGALSRHREKARSRLQGAEETSVGHWPLQGSRESDSAGISRSGADRLDWAGRSIGLAQGLERYLRPAVSPDR